MIGRGSVDRFPHMVVNDRSQVCANQLKITFLKGPVDTVSAAWPVAALLVLALFGDDHPHTREAPWTWADMRSQRAWQPCAGCKVGGVGGEQQRWQLTGSCILPRHMPSVGCHVRIAGPDCTLVVAQYETGGGYPVVRAAQAGSHAQRFERLHTIFNYAYWGAPPVDDWVTTHLCNNKMCLNPRHLHWAPAEVKRAQHRYFHAMKAEATCLQSNDLLWDVVPMDGMLDI